MSNYPKWWETTLTIYNKFQDPQTNVVTWYRTVVDNCFWKYDHNKIMIGSTELSTNQIICRIPKDDRFLEKYEWEQLPNDKMKDHFTLGVADIIVKGVATTEINEYQAGQRSSDVIKKYKDLQGCMIINSMTNNTGTCRNNEHYYVNGI